MRVQKCSPLNRKRTCSSTSSSAASLCRPSNPTPSRPTTTTSSSCTHPRTSTSRSCWTSRPSSSRLSTARRDRIVTYLSSPSMLILPLPSPLSSLLYIPFFVPLLSLSNAIVTESSTKRRRERRIQSSS